MRVAHVWLTNFRCHEFVEVAPAERLTALVGRNGEGKTSLLEAVAYLARARSFRGAPDAALVRAGAEQAVVRGQLVRAGRERLVEVEIARTGRNRIQVNRQPVRRAQALEETLRVTTFSPDDLELVKGGPAGRRAYLDDLLLSVSPGAAGLLSDYERVVRQRSALLRSGIRNEEDRFTLAVWNDQLVTKGAAVVSARLGLIGRLDSPLVKAYGDMAAGSGGRGDIASAYEPPWAEGGLDAGRVAEQIEAALDRERRHEIERGVTLVGPHRDEWRLTIGGHDARLEASQGEQRSLALALRLAGHNVVGEAVGEEPVLLLDDVFSELDPGRAAALVAHLPDAQAIVTTASRLPDDLDVELTLQVSAGRVAPQ
ncbi:MAG: DNA replication/repair protein RecF [Actinobacteria bacterium]|nr:DNA replication/repair protein RecF [Actinomycetota bacterium]